MTPGTADLVPPLIRELDSSKGCPFHIHEKDAEDEADAGKCSYKSLPTKGWANAH